MWSFHIDSAAVKVSIVIGKHNVTDWKAIEQAKERERRSERERLANVTRRTEAFAVGLPILIQNMFDAVVNEVKQNYNDARSDPGERTRVHFGRDESTLQCTRAEPHEAELLLAFLGGAPADCATLEVHVKGVSSSGQPDGSWGRYHVCCNSDGAFFFNDLRSGANYLKEDQVRAKFMKEFIYFLV
ncbi:MAG TPA: hypothetical protein VGQ36_28310 [Thermoanaerobaculia bacterium]|nr:hypothetical protein [Thermoanaerobaculia bacterium]